MADWLLGHAAAAYTVARVGGFVVVAAWETVRPLRPGTVPLLPRWTVNLSLLAINHFAMRLLLPVVAIGAAGYAQERGWGLFPALGLSPVVAVAGGLVALDLLRWAIHAMMHRVPVLWRLHLVHHSDLDYDCTIGLRFHPAEALVTQVIVVAAVCALGVSPLTVLVSDVLTIALGYFAHGNVSLPRKWDRLFGTYRAEPVGGQLGMVIGLDDVRDPRQLGLARVLWMPISRSTP